VKTGVGKREEREKGESSDRVVGEKTEPSRLKNWAMGGRKRGIGIYCSQGGEKRGWRKTWLGGKKRRPKQQCISGVEG